MRHTISSTIKMIALGITLILFALTFSTCTNIGVHDRQGENTMTAKSIEQVLKEHTEELMSIPGVIGTAQGLCEGKSCIKVFVIERTPELDQELPDVLEGYPVMIEETGEIRALPKTKK